MFDVKDGAWALTKFFPRGLLTGRLLSARGGAWNGSPFVAALPGNVGVSKMQRVGPGYQHLVLYRQRLRVSDIGCE